MISFAAEYSRFDDRTPSIPLELKRKVWDDLPWAGLYERLEAHEAEMTLNGQRLHEIQDTLAAPFLGVREELGIYRTKVKHLEDTDLLSKITTEWNHTEELLAMAESEVQ